jgi:hypothetical protein
VKSSLFLSLLVFSSSVLATGVDAKRVETSSDKIDYRLVKIENRLKEISQKVSLKAQAPKRVEVVQDNRQVKLDEFKQSLVGFTEGLDQRQLFIRHEMKRTFQKFLSSSNPWNELEGLARNISFYTKAIPGLNVSTESKKYAFAEIKKLNAQATDLMELKDAPAPSRTIEQKPVDNSELVQVGNDLLYLQSDIQGVREDVAQLAVTKIQKSNQEAPQDESKVLASKTRFISLAIFFVCSVVLGFVMRGKSSPRRKVSPRVAAAPKAEKTEPSTEEKKTENTFKLPPLPVDMGLSSSEMEEYLNYLDIPILVIGENRENIWSNNGARRASISCEKYEQLKSDNLIDSLGYPVVINNGVLYRTQLTQVPHSCWSGKTVTLVQFVPHEYSQVEFSSIKNKGKFIADIKSQTKEQNNINTVLVETVDKFKYLFSQSNISFDYLPLDEDAFINMKRDDLDRYCRDVIYMLNRLVLDSNHKHELLLEAKLNNDRVHFKFYLMNYNYQLQPEQQERLNNEFSQLHSIENTLAAYQGRLTLRTLKGEISSLEIDLSFNLYPVGSTYSNNKASEAIV